MILCGPDSSWKSQTGRRHLESEEQAFQQLEKALLGGDRRRAHSALLVWLGRVAPGLGPREFAARYDDEKLRSKLQRISETLYRDGGDKIHLKRLLPRLAKARHQARHERRQHSKVALPPLNPKATRERQVQGGAGSCIQAREALV